MEPEMNCSSQCDSALCFVHAGVNRQEALEVMQRLCGLSTVQKRAASLEHCPWCISKGLTFALRSYRINLQESITLCTNPQCLFPLVSQSLEDVLASLVPVDHPVGCKRNNKLAPGKEDLIEPALKRQRSNEPDAQNIPGTLLNQAEQDAPTVAEGKVNGYHRDSCREAVEKVRSDASGFEDVVLAMGPEKGSCTEAFNLPGHLQPPSKDLLNLDGVMPVPSSPCGGLRVSGVEDASRGPPDTLSRHNCVVSNQSLFKDETISSQHNAQSEHTSLSVCKHVDNSQSDTVEEIKTPELFPFPSQLFWSNSANLCWLDSMLVALVNCRSLKKCRPEVEPRQSAVWQLIREYEDICAAIQGRQQSGTDGAVKVLNTVLEKTNADLKSLRMSVFKQLKPKLRCKLGMEETPVFALPLLLAMDTWAEPLFQSLFHWEFKCSDCGAATKARDRKTLPTFTDIVADWHPLRAVHLAPCNRCCSKHQRRTMILESVPPVFGLHFVQGLPDNDVRNYSFTFNRSHYAISTVIQYNQHLKHFVTWICNSDGSWMEYDDLKHPECPTHTKLQVPAEEMHIVFWEVEEDKEPAACSPSSSDSDHHPPDHQVNSRPGDTEQKSDELSDHSPDQSLVMPHNDTAIICALTAPGDTADLGSTAVDTSIGATTLLDAFEGLSHDDIITFTLVEVTPDFDAQAVNDSGQMLAPSAPITNRMPDSTPDSSTAEPPTTSVSPEVNEDPSPEPTCVTAEVIRGRGRSYGRQRGKKADLSKIDPDPLSRASSEPLNVNSEKPAPEQHNRVSPQTTQQASPQTTQQASPQTTQQASPQTTQQASPQTTRQASPVSSNGNPSLITTQEVSQNVPSSLENRRWSYLLSKNPIFPNKKPDERLAPPIPHAHSTPNPMKRPQGPGGRGPKPQLKKEEGSLPLKAAAMYNSFGIKDSVPPGPLNTAPVLGSTPNFPAPVPPHHQKVPQNTTSPPSLEKSHMEMLSSRRFGSQSSKIPPGLSDTEALRYKLMKKLKAKKKKLAKLNEMLGSQGTDSTDINSPSTVTSSTYDGDSLLLDLLSPATTASNLSPDSTSFIEMIATGQEGPSQLDGGVGAASQVHAYKTESSGENFLDEFFSQVASQRPTEMETEALSALDLFV